MANFGFEQLVVVDPFEPNWRAARSAVDSEQVLESARLVPTVAEALAQATLVFGTGSLEARKPEQTVIQLPDVAPLVRQELTRGGRVALVFGPENHGLTREDLSGCHHLIEIPTSTLQPSMNLGQAVAVCLYEISTRALHTSRRAESAPKIMAHDVENEDDSDNSPRNTANDLDLLAGLIEQTMTASNYSPKGMQGANHHDLRLSLRRLSFTRRDLRRALGLFRRVLHALNR
jgi:tRNA/rRNA methyltransferase